MLSLETGHLDDLNLSVLGLRVSEPSHHLSKHPLQMRCQRPGNTELHTETKWMAILTGLVCSWDAIQDEKGPDS